VHRAAVVGVIPSLDRRSGNVRLLEPWDRTRRSARMNLRCPCSPCPLAVRTLAPSSSPFFAGILAFAASLLICFPVTDPT
jgi:hypothetical protein